MQFGRYGYAHIPYRPCQVLLRAFFPVVPMLIHLVSAEGGFLVATARRSRTARIDRNQMGCRSICMQSRDQFLREALCGTLDRPVYANFSRIGASATVGLRRSGGRMGGNHASDRSLGGPLSFRAFLVAVWRQDR